MRRLKILTWHTHGSYLCYLSQAPHNFFVLSRPGRPPGYGGRAGHFPWGDNVHDLPVEAAHAQEFDCILFQDDHQWEEDQFVFLLDCLPELDPCALQDPVNVAEAIRSVLLMPRETVVAELTVLPMRETSWP